MTDIALNFITTADGFGFGLTVENGDIATDDGLTSAVIYSLFTDRRANSDDVIPDGTENLRGHWGDTFLDNQDDTEGSRLWLLSREKQTTDVLNSGESYALESLQWLIDDGIASAVNVIAEWVKLGIMGLQITITVIDGQNFTDTFEVAV